MQRNTRNNYQRPCLKCRRLFTPDNNSRSYCAEHIPVIKPKKYYKKGKVIQKECFESIRTICR